MALFVKFPLDPNVQLSRPGDLTSVEERPRPLRAKQSKQPKRRRTERASRCKRVSMERVPTCAQADGSNLDGTTRDGNAPVLTPPLPRPLYGDRLIIAGPRETAVREYCKWLESRATEEAYKADFRKICQVILEHHLDLELILADPSLTDPDSGFFVRRGIRFGTARRFLRDINEWATTAMKLNARLDLITE